LGKTPVLRHARKSLVAVYRATPDQEGRALPCGAAESSRGADRAPCADPARGKSVRPCVGGILRGAPAGEEGRDDSRPGTAGGVVRTSGRTLRPLWRVTPGPGFVAGPSSAMARVRRGRFAGQPRVVARQLSPSEAQP